MLREPDVFFTIFGKHDIMPLVNIGLKAPKSHSLP